MKLQTKKSKNNQNYPQNCY